MRRVSVWGGGAIYSHANLTLSNCAFYGNQVPPNVSVKRNENRGGPGLEMFAANQPTLLVVSTDRR